jgi:hypothetical protein
MEDSVLERVSIRFESLVGVEEAEEAGVIDSKIPDKSRVGRGCFRCERVVSGGDGDSLARFGGPSTLPDERRVTSGASTISTDTFRRFLGCRVGTPGSFRWSFPSDCLLFAGDFLL